MSRSKVDVVNRVAARGDRPARHQERPRAGIEERSRQARQRFGAGLVTGDGVAGGQHHPVGVGLQLCDFAGGEQPVIEFGLLSRNAQRQRRFGKALDIAGDEPVGGKIYDTVIGERGCASPWSRSHPCRDECRKRQRRGPLRPHSIRPRYRATAARPMRAWLDRRRRPARKRCGRGWSRCAG